MVTKKDSVEDAVENLLSTCVFLPPKPGEYDFELFRALEVKLRKDGRAKFTPLDMGIDNDFLQELGMDEQIEALQGILNGAKKEQELNDIKQSLSLSNKLSGNVGVDLLKFVKANVSGGISAKSYYNLLIKDMKKTSIKQTSKVANFLEDCAPGFCNYSSGIKKGFERNQGRFEFGSENIEYGLAFVTSYITGSIDVTETDSNNANAHVAVDKFKAGVDARGDRDRKITSTGTVGIRVYFVHLVKNEIGGFVKMLRVFPVNQNNDKDLKKALKRISTKRFMKIFDPIDSDYRVMFEIYDTNEEFIQSRARLQQRVDAERSLSSAENGGSSTQQVSLLTDESYAKDIDNPNNTEIDITSSSSSSSTTPSSGEIVDAFTNSNNILYNGSLDELQAISKAIKKNGTTSVQGKSVIGIKPVIHCKMHNSLPIIYRRDLSGTTRSGRIPNFVHRVEGDLSFLVRVSGTIGNSGIVTVHNNKDWHVREFVEFVKKEDTADRIKELEGQGFFRLHPDEARFYGKEAAVKSGAIVMMGRQILALKKEAVLAAVKKDGMALYYASDEMKADKEVVIAAVKQNRMAVYYASDEMKSDKEVVLAVAKQKALAAVNQDGMALELASDELKADKEVVLAAVKQNVYALRLASDEMKDDNEVVLAAVKQNCTMLKFASNGMKADKEVVLAAVKQNGTMLTFASNGMKSDKEVVLAAVKQDGRALQYASKKMRADKEVVLASVKQDFNPLEFASNEMKADKKMVLAAVKQDGMALQFASEELKADKEVVLAAVKQDGYALEFASNELKADKEVVLAAVKENGGALQLASDEMKADKEVVLAAVTQNGMALEFASNELKADKEVVEAAVKQDGRALELASDELKAEKKVMDKEKEW